MRAVAYVRVSTAGQAEKGVSLEAQRSKVEALAQLRDAELIDTIRDEGASAKSLDRSGVQRVLELIRAKAVDAVLIAKLDRLTRSVRDLVDLVELCESKGVALISAAESLDTSTAAGRMVVNILGAVSQWEREAIGERTATALQFKAANGERVSGRAPYGHRFTENGKRVVPDMHEQATIERARELRASGLSLRKVAARLEDEGLLGRTGQRFGPSQIRGMVA